MPTWWSTFRGRLNDNVAASRGQDSGREVAPFSEGLTNPQLSATLARAFEAVALDLAHGEPQALLQRMREGSRWSARSSGWR